MVSGAAPLMAFVVVTCGSAIRGGDAMVRAARTHREDAHVEGPAAQLGVVLCGSSGEAGRCAAGGVAARSLCSSGGGNASRCGQAKRRAARRAGARAWNAWCAGERVLRRVARRAMRGERVRSSSGSRGAVARWAARPRGARAGRRRVPRVEGKGGAEQARARVGSSELSGRRRARSWPCAAERKGERKEREGRRKEKGKEKWKRGKAGKKKKRGRERERERVRRRRSRRAVERGRQAAERCGTGRQQGKRGGVRSAEKK